MSFRFLAIIIIAIRNSHKQTHLQWVGLCQQKQTSKFQGRWGLCREIISDRGKHMIVGGMISKNIDGPS